MIFHVPDKPRRLIPIHNRHLDIHQYGIKSPAPLHRLYSRPAVICYLHTHPDLLDYFPCYLLVNRIILHYQDARPPEQLQLLHLL